MRDYLWRCPECGYTEFASEEEEILKPCPKCDRNMDKLKISKKQMTRIKLKKRIPLILLSILIFFIVSSSALVLSLDFGKNPDFCTNCHLMQSFYDSWTKSIHGKFNCIECHVDLSSTSLFEFGIVYYTGAYSQPKAEIENETCFSCHEDVYYRELHTPTRFKHREHVEDRGLQCIRCHSRVVHENVRVEMSSCKTEDCHAVAPVGVMTECDQCHQRMREYDFIYGDVTFKHAIHMDVGLKCSYCHSHEEPEKVIIPKDQEVRMKHCGTCHDTKTQDMQVCGKCHNTRDLENCMTCHENLKEKKISIDEIIFEHFPHLEAGLECTSCHYEILPQGEKATMQTCGVCHDIETQDMQVCAKCHDVETRTMTTCSVCHDTQTQDMQVCAKCHDVESPANCLKCHSFVYKSEKTYGDVTFKHSIHLDAGKSCNECHERYVFANVKVTMKTCGNCHAISGNMTSCALCHDTTSFENCKLCHAEVGEKVIEIGSVTFYHSKHLEAGLTCNICHFELLPMGERATFEFCSNCHG